MSDDNTLAFAAKVTTTIEHCTGQCRYVPLSSMQAHRTRLQQAWEVKEYIEGRLAGLHTEWRDVPTVKAP